ncbi:putative S-adenosylmethionine synthase 3-like [Capsicum annuum]|nr:putative S-adenosylmethionine synthase 3-like [Capsicum annuum]
MPEIAAAVFFSVFSSIPLLKQPPCSSGKLSRFPCQSPIGSVRFVAKASGSGGFLGGDALGPYPWEPSDSEDPSLHWVQEEKITLFTADGLIQIGGNLVKRKMSSFDKKQGKLKVSLRSQRFRESSYMDPNQSLCLGALFDIAATNGLDMGRKLCIIGFCRSIEMLSDVVEDTVLEHGGELLDLSCSFASDSTALIADIVSAEKASKDNLQEKLTMTVAVPLLWGVPPASETIHLAVRNGGGIVDKVYWRWDFL